MFPNCIVYFGIKSFLTSRGSLFRAGDGVNMKVRWEHNPSIGSKWSERLWSEKLLQTDKKALEKEE